MKKVTWGVLSTAKIGMEKVTPALMRSQWCDVQAIASRSLESAQAAARKLGIPKAYGSYEELFSDPAIEAIYNPLPNDLHVPMTLAAARAGKHVLCEKPVNSDYLETRRAAELAAQKGVKTKLGFTFRFAPAIQFAKHLIDTGYIGEPYRSGVWRRLATDLKPRHLAALTRTIAFADLPKVFDDFIQGRAHGRIVVEIGA